MNSNIKRGILTGLLVATWLLAGYSILAFLFPGVAKVILRTLTGALGLIILFIGILYAMKSMKAKFSGKRFTYLKAFSTGFVITVIVAVVVSLASFLYIKFINPGLTDDMVKEAEASLKASGVTAEEMSGKLIAVRKEFSLQAQIIAPLIVQTVAGSIFSFILAFFFRHKNKSS